MDSKTFTRGAGILLSITSLPSDYGLGTLGDAAYSFIDLLVDMRQKYWLMLPLDQKDFKEIPRFYSVHAGDPCLIDLNELVREGLLRREELQALRWDSDKEKTDQPSFFKNRYRILQKAYERFDCRERNFLRFCESNGEWLADYAFFMAVKADCGGREWYRWAPRLKSREPAAMKEYEDLLKDEIGFWKFCQYKFYAQWNKLKRYANSRGIQLIGNVSLYIPLDSADVWANREEFLLDQEGRPKMVTGVSGNGCTDEGSWPEIPLYDWNRMEEEHFSWWKQRMKTCMVLYDIIYIDGFFDAVRYYSAPTEKQGQGGKWNKGPGRKLADAIEEVTGTGRIMAQETDASVPGIRRLKEKTGWPGMRPLTQAFDGNTANENLPHNYKSSNLMVYMGTDNNDSIAGYYKNKPEYELSFLYEYLGIRSRREITDSLIRLAYSSIADVVIVQLQDIMTGEADQDAPGQNAPGQDAPGQDASGQDWRWKFRRDGLTEERRSWLRTLAVIYRR